MKNIKLILLIILTLLYLSKVGLSLKLCDIQFKN